MKGGGGASILQTFFFPFFSFHLCTYFLHKLEIINNELKLKKEVK